jgi:superfamily I DNA/RNA helicase
MKTWSQEQDLIFKWFETPTGKHLIVRARAGCGKTTTIIEGANRAPEKSILLAAFNKRIVEELVSRVSNRAVQVQTLHSIGYAAVRRYWEGIGANFNSDRADQLAERVCGPRAPDAIKRLVSKLHTKGREITPHATTPGPLAQLARQFELEPDEQWFGTGYDIDYVEAKALQCMELAATEKPKSTGIDGADMIFLPVRNGWLTKQFDLVVIDEAQDMTAAQLEIAQGVCRGRVCVVGDDRQAMYGFRGADSESLDRLKHELDAIEMGLTTTYRCGKAIVAIAAEIVPDFKCGAPHDGEVLGITYDKLATTAGPGDFVLSRLNAPLVATAMSLLRAGKRTRVAGRDIGKGLIALSRKMKARSVPDFLKKIAAWQDKEVERVKRANREERVEGIKDQAEMLISLADGAKNVDEIMSRIEALFTDDGLGQAGVITCSSVHRAKGLEADRVFVLASTLRDHTQEEMNIRYVAITRAKHTLTWVIEP